MTFTPTYEDFLHYAAALDLTRSQARMLETLIRIPVAPAYCFADTCPGLAVREAISSLRKRLAPHGVMVKTHHGVGYSIAPADKVTIEGKLADFLEATSRSCGH